MKRFKREIRGSISLFLSMVILLLVILEGFLIDGSKVLAAKMTMSSAGDLAMNAGLTYYDDALRRVYGLFAVSKTEAELTENLEKYFRETLGEATGSTGNTAYTDNLISFIQQSITSGWDNEEAGKLIDLSLTSFHASGMENATLAKEYVIKNQILEYMKYRGPASLGYGMIEKIYAFKDLNKQQKVMEAKLNYEENMDQVQEACENAYNAIVAYNTLLNKLTPDHVEGESDTINKAMYETVIAAFALNTDQNTANHKVMHQGKEFDSNWQKDLGAVGHEVDQALGSCRNYESLKGIYNGEGNGPAASGTFISNLSSSNASDHITAAMQAVQLTIGYMEDFDAYKKLYSTWLRWQTYYPEEKRRIEKEIRAAEKNNEDTDDLEDELNDLEEKNDNYGDIIREVTGILGTSGNAGSSGVTTALSAASAVLKEDMDSRMKDSTDRLHTIYEDAAALNTAANLAKQELETLIGKLDTLQEKGDAWQGTISNLPAGDVKTSMQSDYDNKSKDLDRTKIRALQEYLENGRTYAMELVNDIDPVKAVGFGMKEAQGKASYAAYLNNNWNNHSTYKTATQPYTNRPFSGGSAFSVSEWVQNANNTNALTDLTFTVYLLDGSGGQRGTGKWSKMNLQSYREKWDKTITTNDEFFQYLERICPKSDAQEDNDQKEAKNTKKELLEKGKNVSFQADGLPSGRSMAGDGTSKDFTKSESDADDKTVTKNAKENSKASSNFLENVGSLLTKGRDKLYLSEYANKMFSCYTVDKPEGSEVKKTLSGYEFSEKSNYLYKAEVEYILWGNSDPAANVQNTLVTIYGIRFLMNSIYAFTGDPEIRSVSLALATSIAGWTGFGVPLVQSVIIIAFALAESALDLAELKEGKSVPIYKSQKTWTIKPSGIGQEAFKKLNTEIAQRVNDKAKELENNLFEKVNELTADKITEFNGTLTEFSNEKIDDIISVASAAVLTPIEERMLGLVNVVTPDPNKISSQIDQALDSVEASVNAEPDSVMKTAKQQAVSIVRTSCKSSITAAIQSVQNKGYSASEISAKITDTLAGVKNTLSSRLKGTVSGAVNSLTSELQTSVNAGSAKLQEEVSEKLDQYLMRLDCGVSFAELPSTADSSKVHTSAKDALTMDYSEYLWLFIAVTSLSDGQETKMLNRIGSLIEKNLNMADNPNRSKTTDFAMAKAYTFVGVEATADLTTTFFSMPVPTAGGGSATYGPDKFSVSYRGVLGY